MVCKYKKILLAGILILVPLYLPAQISDEITLSRETAITRAIEQVSPAVAGINVMRLQQTASPYSLLLDPFWSSILPEVYRQVESLGSGLVISSDGYVVTNAHVVEYATEVIVTLPGGQQYEVEATYADNLTDIALLKIDANNLPFARLGNSDDLIIGEWVVALGNPLGLFDVGKQPTATAGIISGLHMNFGYSQPGRTYQNMIQTDASINPGNSGGPLVNASGEVIGISSFIFTESQYSAGSIGIGFAIPINLVKEIVEDLRTRGEVDRYYTTGLAGRPLNPSTLNYLGIPSNRGFLITIVDIGSAGEKAGLEIGDVITEANGRSVRDADEIENIIQEDLLRAGDTLSLTIWRDGQEITIPLILGRAGG